jgi:two-component system sensor histidine kinase YesM
MIPVAGIGLVSFNSTISYIRNQNDKAIIYNQRQFIDKVSNKVNLYKNLSDIIYFNQKIQNYFVSPNSDYYQEYNFITEYLKPVLNSVLESTGKPINLDLIVFNDTNSEVINNNYDGIFDVKDSNKDYLGQGTKDFNMFSANRLKNLLWFNYVSTEIVSHTWLQVGNDNQFDNISLIKPMVIFSDISRKIGIMKITVKLEDIIGHEIVNDTDNIEFQMVFDKNNTLLSVEKGKKDFYQKHKNEILNFLNQDKNNTQTFLDYVMVKGNIEVADWKIISVSAISKINENAKNIRNLTIVYSIMALLILFIITFILSSSFSRRIGNIAYGLDEFYKGNINIKVTDKHGDEIGYLARSFNEMSERINTLIKDNYVANLEKKEAQLKALQAQINPHFLYNSLSSINRLANIKDAESVNKMVKALTTFYRMTLNKGREIISISDELSQVKAYVDVYKIRKGEDFNIIYKIDDTVLEYFTIKVIIQPFVENVLEHALFIRDTPLTIIISAKYEENSIVFKVIDDGVGINKDRLSAIFSNKNPITKGYGIKNVDDRIKLQFGSDYGVTIFSRSGIGTTIAIKIPCIKNININTIL